MSASRGRSCSVQVVIAVCSLFRFIVSSLCASRNYGESVASIERIFDAKSFSFVSWCVKIAPSAFLPFAQRIYMYIIIVPFQSDVSRGSRVSDFISILDESKSYIILINRSSLCKRCRLSRFFPLAAPLFFHGLLIGFFPRIKILVLNFRQILLFPLLIVSRVPLELSWIKILTLQSSKVEQSGALMIVIWGENPILIVNIQRTIVITLLVINKLIRYFH